MKLKKQIKSVLSERRMSNGFRCSEKTALTNNEIQKLTYDILTINADLNIFIFNDPKHLLTRGTCYNYVQDKIFVTKNVFQGYNNDSTHPRDRMSPRAVLAHEYYGHRPERQRYIKEHNKEIRKIPYWRDEAFASIRAALNTPNLTQEERAMLLEDARFRAREAGEKLELNQNMKEILYGNWEFRPKNEFALLTDIIKFTSFASGDADDEDREGFGPLS